MVRVFALENCSFITTPAGVTNIQMYALAVVSVLLAIECIENNRKVVRNYLSSCILITKLF